jgi:polysaccharide export outer membrane protein
MILVSFANCGSSKKIVYFQGVDTLDLSPSKGLHDARIMPKDRLTIWVSTTNPEASRQFNMMMNMSANGTVSSLGSSNNNLQEYLVDNDGKINFPVIGFVKVTGLTIRECEARIHDLIMPYMSKTENPIVKVTMSSFRIAVIGETGSRVIPVTDERMSILEAFASAGDLTMNGRRDNILLIRTDSTGQKSTHRLNLAHADIINSPYYYLQQDDVIYIEPNKSLINKTVLGNNTFWLSIVTSLASLTALVISLSK